MGTTLALGELGAVEDEATREREAAATAAATAAAAAAAEAAASAEAAAEAKAAKVAIEAALGEAQDECAQLQAQLAEMEEYHANSIAVSDADEAIAAATTAAAEAAAEAAAAAAAAATATAAAEAATKAEADVSQRSAVDQRLLCEEVGGLETRLASASIEVHVALSQRASLSVDVRELEERLAAARYLKLALNPGVRTAFFPCTSRCLASHHHRVALHRDSWKASSLEDKLPKAKAVVDELETAAAASALEASTAQQSLRVEQVAVAALLGELTAAEQGTGSLEVAVQEAIEGQRLAETYPHEASKPASLFIPCTPDE